MIVIIGVLIGLYVFTRMFQMVVQPGVHDAVKLFAGLTMVASIVAIVMLIEASRQTSTALDAIGF